MDEELLRTVGRIVEEASQTALRLRSSLKSELKPDGSLVTNCDVAAEEVLRSQLTQAVPGTTFWGEEGGFVEEGDAGIWLVDPIDGTTNFAFGQPLWATSAGLYSKGKLRLGAVCLPELGWNFVGALGRPSECNGVPLEKLRPDPIQCHEPVGEDEPDPFPLHGKGRHLGSIVVEAMFVARGMLRACTSTRCTLYDVAASLVILRGVGAEARHVDGRPLDESCWLQPRPIEPFVVLPSLDYVL